MDGAGFSLVPSCHAFLPVCFGGEKKYYIYKIEPSFLFLSPGEVKATEQQSSYHGKKMTERTNTERRYTRGGGRRTLQLSYLLS